MDENLNASKTHLPTVEMINSTGRVIVCNENEASVWRAKGYRLTSEAPPAPPPAPADDDKGKKGKKG